MRLLHPQVSRRLFTLRSVDPTAVNSAIQSVDPLLTTLDAAKDGFFSNFSGKLLGALLANVVIGVIVKYAQDFVYSQVDNRIRSRENINTVAEGKSSLQQKRSISAEAWIQLFICLALDLGGDLSFTLPALGEIEDAAWAPLSAFLIKSIFGSNSVAAIDFIKEILPGTDIIPVATLAWLLQNVYPESFLSRSLGLGMSSSKSSEKEHEK